MTGDQGFCLVQVARRTIERALDTGESAPPDQPWMGEPGATFVTLTQGGRLRGCIGTLTARRPLGEDVRENALAAAFGDPRFSPVSRGDLPGLLVEVSYLSPQSPLLFQSEAEALRQLQPGIDGVVLEAGLNRGTFLPQVWEQLPDPREFLDNLKAKAGLPRGFWGPEVRLFRYTVEHWTEPETL